jgi:hypothetical protein
VEGHGLEVHEVVAVPVLLYGSEAWMLRKCNLTAIQAAEIKFLRSGENYTHLDKLKSKDIRNELHIFFIL